MDFKKAVFVLSFITSACFVASDTEAQSKLPAKKKPVLSLLNFTNKNVMHNMMPVSDEFIVHLNKSGNYDLQGISKMEKFYDSFAFMRSDTVICSNHDTTLVQTLSDGKYSLTAVIDKSLDDTEFYMPGYQSLTLLNDKGESQDLLELIRAFADIEEKNAYRINHFSIPDDQTHKNQVESLEMLRLFAYSFDKYKKMYLKDEPQLKITGYTCEL